MTRAMTTKGIAVAIGVLVAKWAGVDTSQYGEPVADHRNGKL
jgi:hypothetical protein